VVTVGKRFEKVSMPTYEEHILRILSEAEPLFVSEIAERLNLKLRPAAAYTTIEVGTVLQGLHEQAIRTAGTPLAKIFLVVSTIQRRGNR
jgi:predicted transcriptional regulator